MPEYGMVLNMQALHSVLNMPEYWRCWWKIPDVSEFVTTTVLYTKIEEIENRLPDMMVKWLLQFLMQKSEIKVEIKIPGF